MESVLNIAPLIGSKKTLVVAFQELLIRDFGSFENRVFIHFTPRIEHVRHDPKQQEILKYYIEIKECTQIIFISSMTDAAIDSILNLNMFYSLRAALEFNLNVLLRRKCNAVLDLKKRNDMLFELSVISQCKMLMDLYFIKPRIEEKKLQLKAVVFGADRSTHKTLFSNGIIYNDIISMN